jgi:DNA-3-methyladenine glycosylase II
MRRRERALAGRDPVMARLIAAAGPCTARPRLELSPFEVLARAIAHQQLNGVVADRIFGRFKALYAPAPFPEPASLATTDDAALRSVGFSFAKIGALRDLAGKVITGVVPATPELHALDDETIIERITQVRGIGRWTVEMMLMFQLGRPDVLPVDDFGVCNGFRLAYGLKGMPRPRALAEFGTRWAPHRSLAAWYLWRAVDLARAGKLPRPGRAPRVALKQTRAKAVKHKSPAARKRPAAPRRKATSTRQRTGRRAATAGRRAGARRS